MAFIAKKLLIFSSNFGKEGARKLLDYDRSTTDGMWMNRLGTQLVHEHIFFSDGTNIGFGVGKSDTFGAWGTGNFFYYGKHDPEINTFQRTLDGLKDNVLREACYLCSNFGGYAGLYHNCQHWVDWVREKYTDLMKQRSSGILRLGKRMKTVPSNSMYKLCPP